MELNNENKAKFFAQYWGQRILYSVLYGGTVPVESYFLHKENLQEEDCLILRLISQISDEEITKIGEIIGIRNPNQYFFDDVREGLFLTDAKVVDYCRSIGIAVYWMELTVEQMVKAGWIKLTKIEND